ncbi:unnamed protein product [Chondrus crispus]|uniref:Uncharacterized protein n=1 Tax=Chondrus crispus TaxID=2769 RepID=R7QRE7_CHOCR|nr:unnamed protein product [Chondrus crispus]CDF40328.1 unnamed protein product [Chondrus crispus]|eukprot:XP_005710622.1 unnamed protein product [Chondrus crispus]
MSSANARFCEGVLAAEAETSWSEGHGGKHGPKAHYKRQMQYARDGEETSHSEDSGGEVQGAV